MKANSFSKARLDRNEIEKRLRLELEGLDVDKIASEVRNEVNEKAKKRYAETCFSGVNGIKAMHHFFYK